MMTTYDTVKSTFGARHQEISVSLICGFQTMLHELMLVVAYNKSKPTLSHFPVPSLFSGKNTLGEKQT